MNIEEVREYAMALPGVEEDMPYGPDWLIFRIEGKRYSFTFDWRHRNRYAP